jgi:DnaJ-class molecular chaperone
MELKKGEVLCSKCHGSGNAAEWKQIPDYRAYLKCNHCDGEGKLDWIENITGKKEKQFKFRNVYGITFSDFHKGRIVQVTGS